MASRPNCRWYTCHVVSTTPVAGRCASTTTGGDRCPARWYTCRLVPVHTCCCSAMRWTGNCKAALCHCRASLSPALNVDASVQWTDSSMLAAWRAGDPTRWPDGCLHRVRYRGDPVQTPGGFHIHENGVAVSFTRPIDPSIATDTKNHFAQCWNYRYSEAYGSPEFSPRHPGTRGHDAWLGSLGTCDGRRPHAVSGNPRPTTREPTSSAYARRLGRRA